jgi:bacterial/archaeal transporter family-2 protein
MLLNWTLMNALLLLFAFFIGCVIPLQAIINNSLRVSLGSGAVFAAMVNFVVGSVVLVAVCVLSGEKWNSLLKLSSVAPWQLVGGLLGAMFVFGTTLLAPRIGVATMLSLVVAGQILASLVFDRAGILGMTARELSSPRLIGAALVIVGVLLVNFGDRLRS